METANKAEAATPSKPRLRLHHLDGMRGLAALYVALTHAHGETLNRLPRETFSAPVALFSRLMSWGHFSVSLFIVLSGFSLMLPLATSSDQTLRGGMKQYIIRRARRILPPYYVALALSVLLLFFVPALRISSNTTWDNALAPFGAGSLLSHLFVVHNLNQTWIYKINPPLWSVATEWQIYFFFPLLFLPIWRRFGIFATVLMGVVVGVLLHFVPPKIGFSLSQACPWYLGLFAMGMAGAVICFGNDQSKFTGFLRRHSLSLFFIAALFFATIVIARGQWADYHKMPVDILAGIVVTLLMIYCGVESTRTDRGRKTPLLLRLFQCRPLVALGGFSYSLYLIHHLLYALIRVTLDSVGVSPSQIAVWMFTVGVPLSLALAYLFHLIVEKPFLANKPSAPTPPAPASAT